MLTLAELSGATTQCSEAAAPGPPPLPKPEAGPAPAGCYSLNSAFSMGFTVAPKRAASSETRAASMRLGPEGAAKSRPANYLFPCGWLITVKKAASEFVPRTLKTFPTCGFSPQLLCTVRST